MTAGKTFKSSSDSQGSSEATPPSHEAGPANGRKGADAVKADAAGQFAAGTVKPDRDGIVSAKPAVLFKDKGRSDATDATVGAGHGRDRENDGPKSGQKSG